VPFTICCGECRQCKWGNWSCCERSNPNAAMQSKVMGFPSAGMFGYSHLTGGFAGGQAEYLRVPYADVGPVRVPEGLTDEQVLFLTDVFPTGYMAAEHCDITPEDTIAVWGCGPVGLFAIKSCFLLGAKRVIAIDSVIERLALARQAGAETIDSNASNVHETLMELTNGQGPDAVIECAGMESHGANSLVERAAAAVQSTVSAVERPYALNEAIMACRPGGIVSVPGVYIGPVGPVMMGAFMNKSLTMRTGQTHMLRYMEPLMKRVQSGEIDPSFIITHRTSKLEDGPELYETFREKKDGCIKVVMRPHG
jgi:threonine dehydrogenase-like Zn-dependent dehydrogenase